MCKHSGSAFAAGIQNSVFCSSKCKNQYNVYKIRAKDKELAKGKITMAKTELTVRSSAAEFLIFEEQSHTEGVELIYQDGTLWMSQRMMGLLFDVESNTITYHLGEIYKSGELEQVSTTRKIRVVKKEGTRNVNREIDHYNLDAIISVGYRVNSIKATQFRRWATQILAQYTQKGYVIDRKRMENGAFLNEDYFEELLEEIREIRLSERRFYQKLTDIYATSMDYDKNAPTTKLFFAKIQNQLHYAVSHQTAAEIIYTRADSTQNHMGLSTWKKVPDGKILKSDVSIAKNYLSKEELDDLSLILINLCKMPKSNIIVYLNYSKNSSSSDEITLFMLIFTNFGD